MEEANQLEKIYIPVFFVENNTIPVGGSVNDISFIYCFRRKEDAEWMLIEALKRTKEREMIEGKILTYINEK